MTTEQAHKCLSCKISAHADCVGEGCECPCSEWVPARSPIIDQGNLITTIPPTRPDDLTHAQEDR
jgi:hypothetical protein